MVPGELILGLGADEWENEGSGSANSSPHCPRQVVATEFVDGCESPKKRARAKTADLNALKNAVLAEFQESYEAHGATLSQVLAAPKKTTTAEVLQTSVVLKANGAWRVTLVRGKV